MKKVVTIGRQFGSDTRNIGKQPYQYNATRVHKKNSVFLRSVENMVLKPHGLIFLQIQSF